MKTTLSTFGLCLALTVTSCKREDELRYVSLSTVGNSNGSQLGRIIRRDNEFEVHLAAVNHGEKVRFVLNASDDSGDVFVTTPRPLPPSHVGPTEVLAFEIDEVPQRIEELLLASLRKPGKAPVHLLEVQEWLNGQIQESDSMEDFPGNTILGGFY